MATNERNVDRMVEVIDSASQHARKVYYLYLGFIVYCAVTVFSTTDRQLALKGDTAQLPILDIPVPLDGFFILAPILAVGLFVYFMLYLHRLNSLIDGLIETDKSYKNKDLYPWMINIAREPEDGTIGFLQSLFVGLTLWFTLPVTMFIFASKFVKKHEDYLSYFIVALAYASIFIVFWFWNKLRRRNYDELIQYALLPIIFYLFAAFSVAFIPKINDGDFKRLNLNLRNQILVKIPEIGKDVKQGYWVDLEGANLNGADLTNAVLKRANLKDAKLNKAILVKANLEKADLESAQLQKADLKQAQLQQSNIQMANLNEADLTGAIIWGTDFRGSSFMKAKLVELEFGGATLGRFKINSADRGNKYIRINLQGADLRRANLQEAGLSGANLRKVDLREANLQKAVLQEAYLEGADLQEANLQEADLRNANLQEAGLLGTNLQKADLSGANLQEGSLWGANLQGVDLKFAKNLTIHQLCKAGTLYKTKIDDNLLNQVKDKKEGCADILTKESWIEWNKNGKRNKS